MFFLFWAKDDLIMSTDIYRLSLFPTILLLLTFADTIHYLEGFSYLLVKNMWLNPWQSYLLENLIEGFYKGIFSLIKENTWLCLVFLNMIRWRHDARSTGSYFWGQRGDEHKDWANRLK